MSREILTKVGYIVSALLALVLIVLSIGSGNGRNVQSVNNVSIIDGVQIIQIEAKGGYSPRVTTAQAGIPTILRFNTKGTFDCSSSVLIPSLGIARNLPFSGATEISIGEMKLGTLEGNCGMGMYPFEVRFKS